MFYIEEQHKKRKLDFALIHLGPTLIVFLAFFVLTLWSSHDANSTLMTTKNQLLSHNILQTEDSLTERLLTYEDLIRASSGLFYGSDQVTRKDWSEFTNVFSLEKRYPGMQSVGYAKVVQPYDVSTFIDTIRTEGYPDYTISPTPSKVATPVVYIEPMNEANKKVIGFDFASEEKHRAAFETARDSGQIAQTDVLNFLPTESSAKQAGFYMYLPMYKSSVLPAQVSDRQQALNGYIFGKFRAADFFKQINVSAEKNYGFAIYDSKVADDAILYKSPAFDSITHIGQTQSLERQLHINNRNWIIRASIDPAILGASERNKPMTVFWGGILFSVAVAGCIYLLLLNRTNALAQKEANDIQAAKDELLALASHQLRTPATGVKQYVGMLRDGYAGELSKEQQIYVEKAYASNERQLGTINEMLFVAKADAGNFELKISKLNLTSLLGELIDEQTPAMRSHDQSLITEISDHPVTIEADPTYIRMALENLITNATKYTPDGGHIKIGLHERKHEAQITVEDTGVGVAEKDYPMLFQKFSRIPNELTSKVTGSGIGLYLARKILDAHGGSIEFASKVGVGTSFQVVLPIKQQRAK